MIRRQDLWPLGTLAFLLLVTGAWWAFALWPVGADAAPWLVRAREVCFGVRETGLPGPGGWVLLVGEPVGMLAVLLAGWGGEVRAGLRHLARSRHGAAVLAAAVMACLGGLAAAGVRVADAVDARPALTDVAGVPDNYPRLDRPWPEMAGLVDQHGEPFSLARLEGRPALVTFAYAHCTTLCPLLVQAALQAREALRDEVHLVVVALTLDPWRDTPARLPEMVRSWNLDEGDLVLGGEVEAVERALDAWRVARERDPRTGEIAHPALTFLVEADGTIAYASNGTPDQLVALGRKLARPRRGGNVSQPAG